MCDPVTATTAIIAGINMLGTASEISAQNKQADAEIAAANQAYGVDINLLNEQFYQIQEQTALDQVERQRQALRERGRMMVAMGEVGIEGNSPLREIANSFLQESFDKGIMEANKENRIKQNYAERKKIKAERESRINQAKSKKVDPLFGTLLIGSSGLSGAASGRKLGTTLFGD